MGLLNVNLSSDENVLSEYEFARSLVLFFVKSKFALTNKRLLAKIPNVFLLVFPFGSDDVTYPLSGIVNVKLSTKLKFITLFLGVVFILVGLSNLHNILFLLIGVFLLVLSYEVVVLIQTSAGSGLISMPISPFEKANAQKLVDELNHAVMERH